MLVYCRYERIDAVTFNKTIEEVKAISNVVAYSHCYPGWRTMPWQFNEDITFKIDTNFGYGSASYFYMRVFYKGKQLTPYADLIIYRYALAYQINQYTYSYKLEYDKWRSVMDDAINFYNAVVYKQENKIFEWIKSHLAKLIGTLSSMIYRNYHYFENEIVEDEPFILVKANKIANSTEFIENIKALPSAVNPTEWLDRLYDVYAKYVVYADKTSIEYSSELSSLKEDLNELECDWRLILADWFIKKFEKNLRSYPLRLTYPIKKFLLRIRNRFFPSYAYKDIKAFIKAIGDLWEKRFSVKKEEVDKILETLADEDIKAFTEALVKLWEKRESIKSRIISVEKILETLRESREVAGKYAKIS